MPEGGVRANPIGGLMVGAQVAYEGGRVSAESSFLKAHNFEDIGPGASVGVHAEFDWSLGRMPFNALVRYRHNMDPDLGAQTDVRLTASVFAGAGVRAVLYGPLTSWSDDKAPQAISA